MTASVTELTVTAEDRRVAWLATAAVALSLVDAAIPSPLPGVKPGLANIVTLVVLIRYGWATAVWVSGLRVLAGSLLLGYFLAPGFFLALTGTTLSLATLGLAVFVIAATVTFTLGLRRSGAGCSKPVIKGAQAPR